ncbi:hypothetical protein DLAC_08278 [Tieghemostelium lacteum]|uniref:Uncharacterized protein n=1 Tax=Tieghemostelium lacteum TaxID=361077 RepID=A0A151ZBL7_TIELA|nr:hypothetical protein DLAC_08278 [Tieghemostelium lacteum]|eukprot:KYQ91331.1 hypothetical protein DLAC_08278 [Tieghemostelium lacteum]
MIESIIRQSIGINVSLGSLYNITTEKFNNNNIFNNFPNHCKNIKNQTDISSQYFSNKNYNEKLGCYYISNDQKVTVDSTVNSIISLSSLDSIISGGLVFRIEHRIESFDYTKMNIHPLIKSKENLISLADHWVVTSIKYGINLQILFEKQEFDESDRIQQQHQLNALLDRMNKSGYALSAEETEFINKFSCSITTEASHLSNTLPNSFDNVYSFLNTFTSRNAIEYTLVPLASIISVVYSQEIPVIIPTAIPNETLSYLVSEYENYYKYLSTLKHYSSKHQKYRQYLSTTTYAIGNLINSCSAHIKAYEDLISTKINTIRSSSLKDVKLLMYKALLDYNVNSYNPELDDIKSQLDIITKTHLVGDNEILEKLVDLHQEMINYTDEHYSPVLGGLSAKLDLINEALEFNGISVIGRSLPKSRYITSQKIFNTIYILNYTRSNLTDEYLKSFLSFYYRVGNDGQMKSKFYLYDVEIHQLPATNKPFIEFYHQNVLKSSNFNIQTDALNTVDYINVLLDSTPNSLSSSTLVMQCPGRFCSKDYLTWKCSKCLVDLILQSDKLYCQCGSRVAAETQFKCSYDNHEKDLENGKNSRYINVHPMTNDHLKSLFSILPDSLLQQPAAPINIKGLYLSSFPNIDLFLQLFKYSGSAYKFSDIVNMLNSNSPEVPNMSVAKDKFIGKEDTFFRPGSYLDYNEIFFYFGNDSNYNTSLVSKIANNMMELFVKRTCALLVNIQPTKSSDGLLIRKNDPTILQTLISNAIPFKEYFFDIEGLKSLIENPESRLTQGEPVYSKDQCIKITNSWRSFINEFKRLLSDLQLEQPKNLPFLVSNLIGQAKIYQGSVLNLPTDTWIQKTDSQSYPSDTNFVQLQRRDQGTGGLGSVKLYEGVFTGPWTLKFTIYLHSVNSDPWADGVAIVIAKKGTQFNNGSGGSNYGHIGLTDAVAVDFFPQIKQVYSKIISTQIYVGPNEYSGTQTHFDNNITGFLSYINGRLSFYSTRNILDSPVISYPIDIYSKLGNELIIGVNGSTGQWKMDQEVGNFYIFKQ